jgi:hypothetical protein
MHDLRKKILLESGKTLSRKARARPESGRSSAIHTPNTSPGHSRAGSRPSSRYASEDEEFGSDSEYDDVMTMRFVMRAEQGLSDMPEANV